MSRYYDSEIEKYPEWKWKINIFILDDYIESKDLDKKLQS